MLNRKLTVRLEIKAPVPLRITAWYEVPWGDWAEAKLKNPPRLLGVKNKNAKLRNSKRQILYLFIVEYFYKCKINKK
jgi:hypothetical protein